MRMSVNSHALFDRDGVDSDARLTRGINELRSNMQ